MTYFTKIVRQFALGLLCMTTSLSANVYASKARKPGANVQKRGNGKSTKPPHRPKIEPQKNATARQHVSLQTWDTKNFSKPHQGLVREYTFLVTATNLGNLRRLREHGGDLQTRKVTYASLITDTPGKNKTIGKIGFILDADPANIAHNYHTDTIEEGQGILLPSFVHLLI